MAKTTYQPFHESIIETLDALKIENARDLPVLNALALLTAKTAVPRDHRPAVGAAFARREMAVRQGPSFRQKEEVLANIARTIAALVEQDDQD